LATTKTSLKAIGFDDTGKALIGRLLRDHLRPYVGTILAALLCGALVAVATGAFTQLIKPIIDDIFGRKDASLLWPIAIATLVVFLVKGLSTYGQSILMSRVGHRIVADLAGSATASSPTSRTCFLPGWSASTWRSTIGPLRAR
jgi:subfamily B ATP-binding cassette protein MsbA